MAFLHRRLLQGGHGRLHVLSAATAGDQTDGIDAAGLRVAREIEAACDAIGPSGSLSIVAHSNGGLVGRWALGELLEPATEARGLLDRWRPQLFLTLASPHLGVFPFGLFWSERLVRRVASLGYFGTAGRQLALLDSGSGNGETAATPLLLALAEPRGRYVRALRRFERRVAVANRTNEVLVPYPSAALLAPSAPLAAAPRRRAGGRSNVVGDVLLPALDPRPPAAADAEEEGPVGAAASTRRRSSVHARMLRGLRSAGEWRRVDVDFGLRGALGWAHWLVAGVSLPLPERSAAPSSDFHFAATASPGVGSAAAGGGAAERGAHRSPRLKVRSAVTAGVRWVVSAVGQADALAEIANLAVRHTLEAGKSASRAPRPLPPPSAGG